MGVEVGSGSEVPVLKCRDSSLRPLSSRRLWSRHRRSKSYPDKRVDGDRLWCSPQANHHLKLERKDCIVGEKKQSQTTSVRSLLKKEILQLESHLQDQFATRRALEKALGYRSSFRYRSIEKLMPKSTKKLINEIAVLELEVVHWEQYLLSLYRRAFDQQFSVLPPPVTSERLGLPLAEAGLDSTFKKENLPVMSSRSQTPQSPRITENKESSNIKCVENLMDRSVQRSHSSLSHRSMCPSRASPPLDNLDKALRSCHSQPLSFLRDANFIRLQLNVQYVQNGTTSVISLAEHLGVRTSDHVPETPNRLSENIIRSMSAIYCKLAEPPLVHYGQSSSPTSSFSSTGAFSPLDQSGLWSPNCRKESSSDMQFGNSFQVEEMKEFSGPYSSVVEVSGICRDSQRLNDVEDRLQNFKELVQRLEKVDPSEMKHEEKLAFWINVHNALVMHAYLVYGIPLNNLKRGSLLMKAAYNVGGQTLSADTIQTSILGCRSIHPGQWLRTLFLPKTKLKGVDRLSYAIEHAEPLVYFSLCAGCHSDPAVRIYTPKRVLQELEAAKEEYMRATISVGKEHRILLPKIVEFFAKDSNLNCTELVNMARHCLPKTLQKTALRIKEKPQRNIEWIPHNFTFRYLLYERRDHS